MKGYLNIKLSKDSLKHIIQKDLQLSFEIVEDLFDVFFPSDLGVLTSEEINNIESCLKKAFGPELIKIPIEFIIRIIGVGNILNG